MSAGVHEISELLEELHRTGCGVQVACTVEVSTGADRMGGIDVEIVSPYYSAKRALSRGELTNSTPGSLRAELAQLVRNFNNGHRAALGIKNDGQL